MSCPVDEAVVPGLTSAMVFVSSSGAASGRRNCLSEAGGDELAGFFWSTALEGTSFSLRSASSAELPKGLETVSRIRSKNPFSGFGGSWPRLLIGVGPGPEAPELSLRLDSDPSWGSVGGTAILAAGKFSAPLEVSLGVADGNPIPGVCVDSKGFGPERGGAGGTGRSPAGC